MELVSDLEAFFLDSPLLTKSKAFALRIIKVCSEVMGIRYVFGCTGGPEPSPMCF